MPFDCYASEASDLSTPLGHSARAGGAEWAAREARTKRTHAGDRADTFLVARKATGAARVIEVVRLVVVLARGEVCGVGVINSQLPIGEWDSVVFEEGLELADALVVASHLVQVGVEVRVAPAPDQQGLVGQLRDHDVGGDGG